MLILLFSILGFAGFLALDIPALRKYQVLRIFVSITAILSLVIAFTLATREGAPLGIPATPQWIGIPLMIVGGGLMIYSVLIEIPLAAQRSPAVRANEVFQSGTYALCRHPGFLWMLIYLIGTVLVYNLTSILQMAVYWQASEFLVVIIQDRLIFPRQFPSYVSYRRTTPFVIPTKSSLRASFQIKQEAIQ